MEGENNFSSQHSILRHITLLADVALSFLNFPISSFCFTLPGAKEQGAAGFFKGLGKGVVGVVARPAGGLVDFASSTFEGIKG